MEKPTLQEIITAAKKYSSNYNVIAIRTQEIPFKLGTINHQSSVWIDGSETNKKIKGISATNINNRKNALLMHTDNYNYRQGYYFGDYVAIIGGNNYKYGYDDGEVIINDAIVLEILR